MKKIYFNNLDNYIGKTIVVEGFIDHIRNLQYVQFIILRDSTGKLQITIEKNKAIFSDPGKMLMIIGNWCLLHY